MSTRTARTCLVPAPQRSVTPPLLLAGGRKFSLRIYLLLVAPAARRGAVVGRV